MDKVKLCVCLLFCFLPKGISKQKIKCDTITEMTIVKTYMNMESVTRISCDKLYMLYPIDTFFIKDKNTRNTILKQIQDATPCNANCKIDARAKIFIAYKSGKIDSLCLGFGYVFSLNNRCMELHTKKLIDMLVSMDRD